MRRIIQVLVLGSLIAYGMRCGAQIHCIPLTESRRLHEDATKRYYFEALSDSLSSQVELLEGKNEDIQTEYEKLLALERGNIADLREKYKVQNQITDTYVDEVKHLKKKVRSRTWQRNALGIIVLALVVVSVGQ